MSAVFGVSESPEASPFAPRAIVNAASCEERRSDAARARALGQPTIACSPALVAPFPAPALYRPEHTLFAPAAIEDPAVGNV